MIEDSKLAVSPITQIQSAIEQLKEMHFPGEEKDVYQEDNKEQAISSEQKDIKEPALLSKEEYCCKLATD